MVWSLLMLFLLFKPFSLPFFVKSEVFFVGTFVERWVGKAHRKEHGEMEKQNAEMGIRREFMISVFGAIWSFLCKLLIFSFLFFSFFMFENSKFRIRFGKTRLLVVNR